LFGGNNVRVMATPSADFESTLPTEGWVNFWILLYIKSYQMCSEILN
jgi:hypothetical protein